MGKKIGNLVGKNYKHLKAHEDSEGTAYIEPLKKTGRSI